MLCGGIRDIPPRRNEQNFTLHGINYLCWIRPPVGHLGPHLAESARSDTERNPLSHPPRQTGRLVLGQNGTTVAVAPCGGFSTPLITSRSHRGDDATALSGAPLKGATPHVTRRSRNKRRRLCPLNRIPCWRIRPCNTVRTQSRVRRRRDGDVVHNATSRSTSVCSSVRKRCR